MNLDRMLIERMENRILLGLVTFVATMVIVGWIAINEPARMAAFSDQYSGRSIERGAYLFNQNCSTCHGVNGYGQVGRAPGLNSPHLFGYDVLAAERRTRDDLQSQVDTLQEVVDEYDTLAAVNYETERNTLLAEQTDLETELGTDITAEREEEINTRLTAIEDDSAALEADEERLAELETDAAEARTQLEELTPQLEEAVAAFDARVENELATAVQNGYDPESPERLSQVSWGGGVRSYILTTLVHGRPGSGQYWSGSEGMAAWGQTAGGPLREDQLEDLTSYIMNWDKGDAWTAADLAAVAQFAKIPVDGAGVQMAGSEDMGEPVGTDVDEIVTMLADFEGDPANGESLYTTYACSGCHLNAAVAPPTELQWAAATNGTDGRPYAGEPVRYLVESIVQPGAYIVNGYAAGAMPGNFGDQITYQQMADILAFIESAAQ